MSKWTCGVVACYERLFGRWVGLGLLFVAFLFCFGRNGESWELLASGPLFFSER